MAYIGGTWVETVMWPVMMQTILISNVQERKWRRLASLSGRGWIRSTFWGLLTFVVSWYARHDISILLCCCHHPPNKPASLLHTFFLVHLICGYHGGNGLHRRHMSQDCNVTSDDADNPNIKCTRKKVWRRLAGLLGGWWQQQSRMEMSCRAYRLTTKVSSPQKVDLNQPLPDDWCRLIFQNHIMPALFDHDFGGNRESGCTLCLSIWSPASVSTWTTKVYIDISVQLLLCLMSFSGVVGQAELTWCTQYWSTR